VYLPTTNLSPSLVLLSSAGSALPSFYRTFPPVVFHRKATPRAEGSSYSRLPTRFFFGSQPLSFSIVLRFLNRSPLILLPTKPGPVAALVPVEPNSVIFLPRKPVRLAFRLLASYPLLSHPSRLFPPYYANPPFPRFSLVSFGSPPSRPAFF